MRIAFAPVPPTFRVGLAAVLASEKTTVTDAPALSESVPDLRVATFAAVAAAVALVATSIWPSDPLGPGSPFAPSDTEASATCALALTGISLAPA